MEPSASIDGLEEVLKTLEKSFPQDQKKQAQIVGAAIASSARKTILPLAKSLAKQPGSSGALSESLNLRATPSRVLRQNRRAAGRRIVPVRYDPKAISKYIAHYYTNRGRAAPLGGIAGIRHGHLVEFGFTHKSGRRVAARPFLWNSARAKTPEYRRLFAGELKRVIERRVKAAARKKK